jgi:hypothetical protein
MNNSRNGQSSLPLVLLIGGIIISIGVALAAAAISFINSSYGFQAANRAEAVAYSGINDALLQLDRNKAFSSSGYCIPSASLPCPSGTATVSVTQGVPSGRNTIMATGTVVFYTRVVKAIVNIDSTTGLVTVVSEYLQTQ